MIFEKLNLTNILEHHIYGESVRFPHEGECKFQYSSHRRTMASVNIILPDVRTKSNTHFVDYMDKTQKQMAKIARDRQLLFGMLGTFVLTTCAIFENIMSVFAKNLLETCILSMYYADLILRMHFVFDMIYKKERCTSPVFRDIWAFMI